HRRRGRPVALGQRVVERPVVALREHPVREQPDQRRGGERDRPEEARAHAASLSRADVNLDKLSPPRGRCPMAKTLASQAKNGGSIPLARLVPPPPLGERVPAAARLAGA